jgi:hypothetical protein
MMNPQSVQQPRQPQIKAALAVAPLSSTWIKGWQGVFSHRLMIYICMLLIASIGAWGYGIRTRTIFACQAGGYSADRYVASCNGANYGDYEHGAFQFNLEPSVQDSVKNADVLFLGNSRLQLAFSAVPTEQWFSTNSARYYLMGFTYFENELFASELLNSIHPRPKVYIINVDDFFEKSETAPVKMILHDPNARSEYAAKRFWQRVHERICGTFKVLCGNKFVIFRSRNTGAYYTQGSVGRTEPVPVSYDPVVDQNAANANITAAVDFLSRFTQKKCVILTMVPYVGTKIGTAKAIASGIGLKLMTPDTVQGLRTFDGYHLDQPSAQRWSQAFFQAAGPEIRSCLDSRNAADRQGTSSTGAAASVQSATTSTVR